MYTKYSRRRRQAPGVRSTKKPISRTVPWGPDSPDRRLAGESRVAGAKGMGESKHCMKGPTLVRTVGGRPTS